MSLVTVSIAGDSPPSPRASPASNSTWPACIGLAGGEDFVVARDQPHLGIGDRIGRGQRIDEHMDAVIAGKRRQPHVGDDEPLRRELAVIVAAADPWPPRS